MLGKITILPVLGFGMYFTMIVTIVQNGLNSSDAPELSSTRLGSARIQLKLEGFQLGSAREIFEPARLAKIGHIRAKIGSVQAMKKE